MISSGDSEENSTYRTNRMVCVLSSDMRLYRSQFLQHGVFTDQAEMLRSLRLSNINMPRNEQMGLTDTLFTCWCAVCATSNFRNDSNNNTKCRGIVKKYGGDYSPWTNNRPDGCSWFRRICKQNGHKTAIELTRPTCLSKHNCSVEQPKHSVCRK